MKFGRRARGHLVCRFAPSERVQVIAGLGRQLATEVTSDYRALLFGDGGVACHELGEVAGVCAEAPLPRIRAREHRYMLEGVGGIASMLRFWGMSPIVWCPLGPGEASRIQRDVLKNECIPSFLIPGCETQLVRYTRRSFAGGHQLAHVESEELIKPRSDVVSRRALNTLEGKLVDARVLCIVDKGGAGIKSEWVARLIRLGKSSGLPVLYEPRSANVLPRCACDIVKINHNQIRDWFGMNMESDHDALAAAELLMKRMRAKSVICTRGEHGIVVRERTRFGSQSALIIPQQRKLFDLVSAGDVVTAALTFCLALRRPLFEAACFAASAAELSLDRRHDKHLDIKSIVELS